MALLKIMIKYKGNNVFCPCNYSICVYVDILVAKLMIVHVHACITFSVILYAWIHVHVGTFGLCHE